MSHFSAISLREQVIFDEMMILMMSTSYSTNTLSWIFILLADWNTSSLVEMLLHSRHIILISSNTVSVPTTGCCMLSKEVTNTNCIDFVLIQLGLKSTTYCTCGQYTNHNTTILMPLPFFACQADRYVSQILQRLPIWLIVGQISIPHKFNRHCPTVWWSNKSRYPTNSQNE